MGAEMEFDDSTYCSELKKHKATFVTLKLDGLLRGCIGNLIAKESLIQSIAHNAYSAAFRDPRFDPVQLDEIPLLAIEISILSDTTPIQFDSEQELIENLKPGIDGVVLSDNVQSGTFLPSVWEQVSTPEAFLRHLKVKAGFNEEYWSDDITAERYSVNIISNNKTAV